MSLLSKEVEKELSYLSSRQRKIVLSGLKKKLSHFKKTGILSYKYEVCPICNDIGSTLEDPKCEKCYLKIGCKEPFNRGFRDDVEMGVQYFSEMQEYLLSLVTFYKERKMNTKKVEYMGYDDCTEFTIKATMRNRWIPHFLSMLKYMQYLGGVGSSRKVSIFTDGDGDFRPGFEWDDSLPSDAKPVEDKDGDRFYDAG